MAIVWPHVCDWVCVCVSVSERVGVGIWEPVSGFLSGVRACAWWYACVLATTSEDGFRVLHGG